MFLPFITLGQSDGFLLVGNNRKLCINEPGLDVRDTLPANYASFKGIFIFSNAQSILTSTDLQNLTLYVHNGGNLYVGGENWPLQAEVNEITEYLFNKQCYGNFSVGEVESAEEGRLELKTLDKIPSGESIIAFPLDPRLKVEAWVNDQPLIMSGILGKGKLIIDGGYSRFYCELSSSESLALFQRILAFFND